MRKLLVWVGVVLCGIGVVVIVVSAVMHHMGYDASYNFGDPTKFEFVLIPLWQAGLAIAVLGGACLLGSRRLKREP